MAQYLTQQDVQDYGSDLVDFSQRAALQAVVPHIQALDQQNAELQRRLSREARFRLDAEVERAVPNYRDIDNHPAWHRYLLEVDPLSGRVRQNLLNESIAASDAPRTIAFFRKFLQQHQGGSHAPSPSPGRARSAPSSGKVYTRAEISKLFEQHRRGAYVGREDAWARQEADIVRAGAEGRILNPDIITK
jgi:hypothetical protein